MPRRNVENLKPAMMIVSDLREVNAFANNVACEN